MSFKTCQFQLSSPSQSNSIRLSNVWVVDDLNILFSKLLFDLTKKYQSYIQDILLSTARNKVPLIIEADMPEFHVHLEYRHGKQEEPIGIKTTLGYVLFRAKDYHKHPPTHSKPA